LRPSKRTAILDAALRVIEHGGVTEVTFESVAAEAGMTKGGLLYHFPTREALLKALHQYLADQWESSLEAAAGTTSEQATSAERLAAYARVACQSATRAELLLMLETANEPAMHAPWIDILDRWASPASLQSTQPMETSPSVHATQDRQDGLSETGLSETELRQLITRLAADGLWLNESLPSAHLRPAVREQLLEHLATLANPAGAATPTDPTDPTDSASPADPANPTDSTDKDTA